MNTVKKNGGFTLVELIIVIAILAILSSVAVAGYSSYITKANDSAADSFMNEIKTHVVLANAEAGGIASVKFSGVDASGNVTVIITAEATGFVSDFPTEFNTAYGQTPVACKDDGTVSQNAAENTCYKFTVVAPNAYKSSSYKTAGKTINP